MGLDQSAVDAALQYIAETFGELMPAVKDDWRDVLPHLEPGELRPVLDRWVDIPPDPHAVLDYIQTGRRTPPTPAKKPDPDYVQGIIDKAREDIRGGRARNP
jgi:hypothetical protein